MPILDPHGRPIAHDDADDHARLSHDQLAPLVAAEIAAKATPCVVSLDALSAFTFAKLIQLALLHPDVNGHYAENGRQLVDLVREYFGDAPHVLEQLRRGEAIDPTVPGLGAERFGRRTRDGDVRNGALMRGSFRVAPQVLADAVQAARRAADDVPIDLDATVRDFVVEHARLYGAVLAVEYDVATFVLETVIVYPPPADESHLTTLVEYFGRAYVDDETHPEPAVTCRILPLGYPRPSTA